MSTNSYDAACDDATAPNRRGLLRGAGLATAAALAGTALSRPAQAAHEHVVPAPVYFPTSYVREVNLINKNIVITGASRGIGRATALDLVKAGANVWGTSRTPQDYPGITEYPLMELRLEDPASIAAFVAAIGAATGGRVDVLINNAAQLVFGTPTPLSPAAFPIWAQNSALALRVVYLGHRELTIAMLGLMQHSGYRRILFTASVAAYASSADIGSDFYQPYVAGKRAIADFANSLGIWFSRIGLDIRVATVNPVTTHTDGTLGTRPIFLEPVDEEGNPDPASPLAAVLPLIRAAVESGQPAKVVARAYRQLLELKRPHPNVVAGVRRGPLAEAGQVPLTLAARRKEMKDGAMPWACE